MGWIGDPRSGGGRTKGWGWLECGVEREKEQEGERGREREREAERRTKPRRAERGSGRESVSIPRD